MRRRDLLSLSAALGVAPGAPGFAPGTLHAATPAGGSAAPGQAVRTHALSLLGEPQLPADFPHFPWVNPDAPKGGEIARWALGAFDSFNPFIIRGTAAVGSTLIYDALLKESADEASTEYPYLAQWIDLPADRKGVTFELNPAARWHDGRPVTAADVVWTFNSLRQHGRPFFRSYYGDVTEVAAEGERRVVFRFRSDENRELALILGQLPVLPRHWWETRDFTRPILEPPLGSGPYRIDRFDAGRNKRIEHIVDHRLSADLNQRLRGRLCNGAHPRTESGREHHGLLDDHLLRPVIREARFQPLSTSSARGRERDAR
jgi:microcin C transport system substrate-binding protein